jgi:hypothetical protein
MPLERCKLGKSKTRLSPEVLLQIHICKVMMVSCSAHVQKLEHYEMAAEALTRNTDFQAVYKHACNVPGTLKKNFQISRTFEDPLAKSATRCASITPADAKFPHNSSCYTVT